MRFHLLCDFFLMKTTQVENMDNVRDLPIEKRHCRYSDERWPSNASLPYGFVSCLIYSRVQIELELCNCTGHFAPIECNGNSNGQAIEILEFTNSFLRSCPIDKDRYCNYKQMKCIADHETKTLMIRQQHNIKTCLSSCTELHVGFVGYAKYIIE